tara:strand:+ start:2266 stop:3132 length:867 start_codon:yes stop_codon:yes gene_type:complete
MSILITGSSSFIGKKLITRLKQKKIRFIGIDSKKVNIKNCFKINICDKNLNKKIKHNIKSIIHLAAISNSKDCASDLITCYKNNVLGTINILNFAKKRGIKKIIFASSEWVYGNKINLKSFNKNLNINNIIDDYSLSKILCEKIISKNKSLISVILRFGIIYGDRHYGSAVESITNSYFKDSVIRVTSKKSARSFIHVDDIVEATIKSLKITKNSIFDIQGPELVSVKKILDLLSKKYPRKIKIKEISPDNFSIRKITNNYNKNLNWKPKIFVSEGINRIYKKYYNKQ